MAADAVVATGWSVRMVEATPPRVLTMILEQHERREARRLFEVLRIVRGGDPEALARAYAGAAGGAGDGQPGPADWSGALAELMKAAGDPGAAARVERRRRTIALLAKFPATGAAA